jgi:hypothetical protein
MAENWPIPMEETGTREENLPPPMTAEEFEAQPEFATLQDSHEAAPNSAEVRTGP